jgi:hypothetical protein
MAPVPKFANQPYTKSRTASANILKGRFEVYPINAGAWVDYYRELFTSGQEIFLSD